MTKISSGLTWWHKRAFPAVWFGFLVVFLAVGTLGGAARKDPMFLVVPVAMAVFGYFFMRKLLWDLMDEVYDCGDSLLVKNAGQEELIPLANIMNVSDSSLMNPPRVTLRLVYPSRFGSEVTFSPAGRRTFKPLAKNEVAQDLIVRVDQARSRRATGIQR